MSNLTNNISNIEDVGNILLSVHKELEKVRLALDNANKLSNVFYFYNFYLLLFIYILDGNC